MIHENTITQIRLDYYHSDDQHTLQITAEEADQFWNWFSQRAEMVETAAVENEQQYEMYQAGDCFHNALTELQNNGSSYWEGFFISNHHYYLHAFNVQESRVLDVTSIGNRGVFEDANNELPTRYYGIEIPHDFINANQHNGCQLRHYFHSVIGPN